MSAIAKTRSVALIHVDAAATPSDF